MLVCLTAYFINELADLTTNGLIDGLLRFCAFFYAGTCFFSLSSKDSYLRKYLLCACCRGSRVFCVWVADCCGSNRLGLWNVCFCLSGKGANLGIQQARRLLLRFIHLRLAYTAEPHCCVPYVAPSNFESYCIRCNFGSCCSVVVYD